jgi:protein TonB
MEANKILSADILDVLFDGRNKEYGAYQLRKTYNGRLGRALLLTGGIVVVLFCFGFVSGKGKVVKELVVKGDVEISAYRDEILPPPPPPPPVHVQQVATVKDVTIRIVPDNVKTDPIPENKDFENAKIGTVTLAGKVDDLVGPPVAVGVGSGGVVEKPKEVVEDDRFIPIEKEAEYPGGVQAWIRYLGKNMRAPDGALNEVGQSKVVVQFTVDKDGNVSDVVAISGPDNGMREEAVRVIKKSGKWVPALQNGRYVKTIKVQPVIFDIEGN